MTTDAVLNRAGAPTGRETEEVARLYEALARVTRLLRRQSVSPWSASMLSALGTVVDAEEIRLGDLAAIEGVTPATLSRVVAALERGGLVTRTPDPQDRRSSFLAATDAGRSVRAEARAARTDALLVHFERLDAGTRALLVAALPAIETLASEG